MFVIEKKKLLIKRLYDLDKDPLEIKNLIYKEELRHIIKKKKQIIYLKNDQIYLNKEVLKNTKKIYN